MDKDLLIIGGGINGVGTAADAAGRGLSVVLCEMGDLANATSSASSKLIHGGLRYLENYDFKLVRESLQERKILMRLAPHIIKRQSFIMPQNPDGRPFWLLRCGLFLYDHLVFDRTIPNSRALTKSELTTLDLQQFTNALQFYDCTADDSRLVLHVALLAKQHGAEILPRTKLVKAIRKEHGWIVSLLHENDLKVYNVKAIINAAGPWVREVATETLQLQTDVNLKLVKGSHIVVPRLFKHNQAFVLQNNDGRIVFVIPYQEHFTLIGTTEVLLNQIEQPALITNAEIEYLRDITKRMLKVEIPLTAIVYKYAGIRALHADDHTTATKMSREWLLDINDNVPNAPAISIYGGKITTYRSLAENVVNKLHKYFPNLGKPWTAKAYLPGGYFPNDDLAAFTEHIFKTYAPIPQDLLLHYINTYGTRTVEVLMNSHNLSDLGRHFGGQLYKREVDYLRRHEWATSAEDILWRRGKQGLLFTAAQRQDLDDYLNNHKG